MHGPLTGDLCDLCGAPAAPVAPPRGHISNHRRPRRRQLSILHRPRLAAAPRDGPGARAQKYSRRSLPGGAGAGGGGGGGGRARRALYVGQSTAGGTERAERRSRGRQGPDSGQRTATRAPSDTPGSALSSQSFRLKQLSTRTEERYLFIAQLHVNWAQVIFLSKFRVLTSHSTVSV